MKKRGWAAAACALSLLLTCCAAPAPSGAESTLEAQATPEPQRQAFDLPFEMVSSPDLTSYGSGTESSGEVKVLKDLSCDCRGRNVLIVEDIIDSGVTLFKLRDAIAARQAQSVEITALLSKPSRRKTQVEVKYVGFEIPDKFVVGYGMDFAEKLRGLPEVCVLKEEEYKK